MPSLVIYYSETGNTELVAKAIAEGVGTRAVKVGVEDAELVVIGSPTHGNRPVEQITEFIKKTAAKKAAIFCTCSTDSGETLTEMEKGLKSRGIEVIGKLEIKVGDKKPTDEHLRKAREFGETVKRC